MEKCRECGKRTEYMYKLNKGTYCDDHYRIFLLKQNQELEAITSKERITVFHNWNLLKDNLKV